jgi:drug/metabolite transporter (DMT)-like permease
MPDKTRGYLMLVTATIFWGLSGAVIKYFFNQAVSPLVMVTVRQGLSGLPLLLIIALLRPGLLRLRPADVGKMLIFGIAGMASVQFFYLYTISQLNVATAVFLQYLAPAFITIYAVWWKKESLGRFGLPALLLALGGSALIVADQACGGLHQHWAGILSGFASALSLAFYMLSGKSLLERYNPWVVLCYGLLFGTVPFLFLEPPWAIYGLHYGWQTWLFFGYIALFATLIPFGLAFMGLRYLKPAPASITMMLEPVMAGVFAYLLLGETLSGMQLGGCGLILAAIVVLNLEQKPAGSNTIPTPSG